MKTKTAPTGNQKKNKAAATVKTEETTRKTPIERELAKQAADSGVPIETLRAMCLQAGLEQYRTRGITVAKDRPAVSPETLPVMMDAKHVSVLNEICAVADIPPGEWFGNILWNFLHNTVEHTRRHEHQVIWEGVIEDMTHTHEFPAEEWAALTPRFLAIIDREKAAGTFKGEPPP